MSPTASAPRLSLAFLLCLLVVAGTGCSAPDAVEPSATAADAAAQEWIDLTDPDRWRGYQSDEFPDGWVIQNGVLGLAEPGGGDILTREQFGDFELELEWRISPCGNSGIFYRGTEDREYVWLTAPEMQVLDNTCEYDYELRPEWSAGAVYDLYAPSEDATRPVGEWNRTRIVARGGHTEYWLNDVRIVEYEQGSDDWRARVAGSKFHDWEDFGSYYSGPIGLQDHGDPVWYRNIRIRRLES